MNQHINWENFKENLERIEVPDEFDGVLATALAKAKQQKVRVRFTRRFIGAVACITLLITGVASTPFTMPVLAQGIGKLTGISYFFKYASREHNQMTAIKSGLLNEVNLVAEDTGIVLTIEDIIADQKHLYLAYLLENREKNSDVFPYRLHDFEIIDKNGKRLLSIIVDGNEPPRGVIPEHIGFTEIQMFESGPQFNGKEARGALNLDWTEKNRRMPLELTLKVNSIAANTILKIRNNELVENDIIIKGNWEIPIKVSLTEEMEPKVFTQKTPIPVGDTGLSINAVRLYPTKTEVEMNWDRDNYKLGLTKFEWIEDENGKKYKPLNGFSDDKKGLWYMNFESAYFTGSSELYMVGWRALEEPTKPGVMPPHRKFRIRIND